MKNCNKQKNDKKNNSEKCQNDKCLHWKPPGDFEYNYWTVDQF